MSETNDGTADATTTSEGEGSPDTGTPDQTGSQTPDELALARKRQAGAEAARQQAIKERDAALAELETFRAKDRSQSDKDLADNAKLKERLEFEQRRADEAEARAEGRILDIKYPNARTKLPELTDEVRLAEFEALLAETDDAVKTPPPPQNPNANNPTSTGANTGTKPKAESSEDIAARLKGMKPDWL